MDLEKVEGQTLMDFLLENDISEIYETIKISKRIPYEFKIKPLTKDQHTEFQKRCQGVIKKSGVNFDSAKFQNLVCAECSIYPNFKDAEFIKKLGVYSPADAMAKVLLPGEQAELYSRICILSGFDSELDEDIEKAKN